MYKKSIPYKDLNGKPCNETIHLHLFEREVLRLLVQFNAIIEWRKRMEEGEEIRNLDPAEVVEFYTNLEEILLEAWGIPSSDGKTFRKAGKWDFQESALFNATMMLFVSDPIEANAMVDALLPKGLADLAAKAESNLDTISESGTPEQKAEIARLRAELAAAQGDAEPTAS